MYRKDRAGVWKQGWQKNPEGRAVAGAEDADYSRCAEGSRRVHAVTRAAILDIRGSAVHHPMLIR
jgi:hypothetical protein